MPDPTYQEIAAVLRYLGRRLAASKRKRLCLSTGIHTVLANGQPISAVKDGPTTVELINPEVVEPQLVQTMLDIFLA